VLPVAVFFPTSRCNSRCVSCDWWKASGEGDLSLAEIARVADSLESLGTRLVVFSGGEPLLRPEVFEIAALFRRRGMTLHLHTSGVLLERVASKVADTFKRVTISLDSPDETEYRTVRGVSALRTVEHGVARLRALAPELLIRARSTIHRHNFRELPRLVEHAKAMALDGISFLAADLGASGFGRADGWSDEHRLALGRAEIVELADLVERVIVEREDDFASGFIVESPAELRRIPQYYAALAGLTQFPPVACNAPYVSVVIEGDGGIRPCLFHRVVGSVRVAPLETVVARNLSAFRSTLSIAENPVCERCVCSMTIGQPDTSWP
jgi:MoaA/NifB/PqqE/SkfB family radical SAM enzyme